MYDCERDFMDNTKIYDSDEIQTEYVAQVIKEVSAILESRGYNPVNQIVGYVMSGDPTYITSYNNARSLMMRVERDEIVEEVLKFYLDKRFEE